MIKKILPLLLLPLLLLSSCKQSSPDQGTQEDGLSLVASTYPIYLFLSEVTRGVEGVTVTPLINQNVSCLHDYSLTVNDMKVLEQADVLFLNGSGLDDFIVEGVHSANPDCQLIDCGNTISPPTALLAQDPAGKDPHYWMDPKLAAIMLQTIADELTKQDADNADLYRNNAVEAAQKLETEYARLSEALAPLQNRKLITFHDGFAYFAEAFDLDIILAVEEEEGQEASAQVIAKALSLIKENQLPAIFTEENSSDATAQAIAREASVSVHPLSLIMSGETEHPGIDLYLSAMEQNVNTILEALQ